VKISNTNINGGNELVYSSVGKTCPYCQFPIKQGSEVLECANCKIPHHEDCWEENGGCTTFGCQGVFNSVRGSHNQANNILVVELDDTRHQFHDSYRSHSSGPQKLPKSFYLWSIGLGFLFGLIFLVMGIQGFYYEMDTAIIYIVLFGLLILYITVVNMVFLYKIWEAIQDGHARTTPGKAVGFMFIPFFNYYWIFPAYWGFAKDFNQLILRRGLKITPIPEGLFLSYPILVLCTLLISYIGIVTIIINLCIINAACNKINELSEASVAN
jgi:hypothetical protein